jgi:Tat protein translocase TatB subunit
MFDIGFSELLLIFGLTLVVLGPNKLPHVARTIGRWVGRARAMARQFREQLEAETDNLKVDINLNTPPPPASPPPPPAAASPAPPESPPPATEDTVPHDRRE